MLASILSPSAARAVLRYLKAAGAEQLTAAATEFGEKDWVVVEKEK